MIGINAGSGQRPFKTTGDLRWINIDIEARWHPDIVGDWTRLTAEDSTIDYVVSHHSYEHVGCGEGTPFLWEAQRVLKPGGSLILIVPDMRALAQRWLLGQITTQIYLTNVYGAYMNDEHDRHRWGYDPESLRQEIIAAALPDAWSDLKAFDWREIPGADIAARDWWMLGIEAVK